jgi:hypothetical protein
MSTAKPCSLRQLTGVPSERRASAIGARTEVTSAHEQERLVFLSMPSQHDIAQTDRAIFQSFAEALHVVPGYKIG